MELNDVKELIKLIDNSKITEFQLDKEDFKILIKKEKECVRVFNNEDAAGVANIIPIYTEKANQVEVAINTVEENKDIHSINSPIIGMFYAAPSPDASNFVKVGDRVKKGDVLCIIEAMKLMNEVISDVDGEISEVLVENKSIVEYGQPLFKVRTV